MSSPVSAVATSTLALKEWAAVAHALLDGRQTLLLRKGGIHEKAFSAQGHGVPFVLFPTVAHSHAERVRAEHQDLLGLGEADVDAARSTFRVRVGMHIVAAVPVRRPEGLDAVEDLHIWTGASIREDRLDFRPRHELQALVVRAVALPSAVDLERTDAYAGCRSWLDLPLGWDGESGTVIHHDDRLTADVDRVRRAVG